MSRILTLKFDSHFKERIDNYLNLILNSDLKPYGYVNEFLEQKNLKFYILSSNSEFAIRKILSKWGIEEKFEKIYSVLNLNLKKSDLIANSNKYFGVKQDEIAIFEDSPKAIDMAKSFGCETVYIYNGENAKNCNFDKIIDIKREYAEKSSRI